MTRRQVYKLAAVVFAIGAIICMFIASGSQVAIFVALAVVSLALGGRG